MSTNNKEIWSDLSQKAAAFELPVEGFVWDAIASEVFPATKKRGFFFWLKIGASILFIGLLAAAGTFLFSSPKNSIDSKSIITYTAALHHMNLHPPSIKANAPAKDVDEIVLGQGTPLTNTPTQQVYLPTQQNKPQSTVKTNEAERITTATPIYSLKNVDAETSDPETKGNQQTSFVNTVTTNLQEQGDSIANHLSQQDAFIGLTDSLKNEIRTVDSSDTPQPSEQAEENAAKEEPRFSLLLRGGVGESFRILTSSSHQDLITHKNDHETFGGCFAAGLDLQFKLSEQFIVRTGIGYKFYSDKYDFQHDLISHRTRNDYQYVQIPLIFGYNLWSNSKSSLYFLAGGNANLLTSAQSSWIDPSLLIPVAHSSQSANTPFRSFTSAITLGLDFNLRLSDHFKVHFIPSVDSFLNSVYKRETDLNELPYSFNLDVGISFHF